MWITTCATVSSWISNIVKNISSRRIKIINLFTNPYSIAQLVSIEFQQHRGYVETVLIQRCINVVQGCFDVVSTLCNVVSTLFRRWVPTLYQRCATLKNGRRILFHFQRKINVISTLIYNVDPILKCWLGRQCCAL